MALKMRLQRGGAAHAPVYRVVVAESRYTRDGRFVEKLGTYWPQAKNPADELQLNLERCDYWQSVGAQPSDTVKSLIKQARGMRPEDLAAPIGQATAEANKSPKPAATPPAAAVMEKPAEVEQPAAAEAQPPVAAEEPTESAAEETPAEAAPQSEEAVKAAEEGEAPEGQVTGEEPEKKD